MFSRARVPSRLASRLNVTLTAAQQARLEEAERRHAAEIEEILLERGPITPGKTCLAFRQPEQPMPLEIRAAANAFHRLRISEYCEDMRRKGLAARREGMTIEEEREWRARFLTPIFAFDARNNPTNDYDLKQQKRLGVYLPPLSK